MKLATTFVAVAIAFMLLVLGGASAKKSVLVLMPSEAFLRVANGELFRVGSFLDETVIPAQKLTAAGIDLTFATTQGSSPIMDPRSNNSAHFADNNTAYEEGLSYWNNVVSKAPNPSITLWAPESPTAPWDATGQLNAVDEFDAVFIPGGHAPMIDMWPSLAVGRILTQFAVAKKPIVAICHGPVALASASLLAPNLPGDGTWPFAGINMTVLSEGEEKKMEEFVWKTKLGFYPPQILQRAGGNTVEGTPGASHIVQATTKFGGVLLTGQNPASAPALGDAFLKLMMQ